MKTVFKVFRDDMKLLSRRFFASAVIVAISILPALYAWVNIYANGNPYANTGGIKIALASYDKGIDLEDGTHVNMAEEVFEEMKGSDKIGWQFPGSPTDAINGVKSGEYYAAVIFQDNFTYNMYNFEQALVDEKAPLIYYENQKANAIAPKITATAASTLQDTIKTKYLETVFGYVFDKTGEISDELSEGDAADNVIAQLTNLRDTLRSYDKSISEFTSESKSVRSGISSTEKELDTSRANARKTAAQAQKDLEKARKSLNELKKAIEEKKKLIPDIPEDQQADPQNADIAQLKADAEYRIESLEMMVTALETALKELGPLSVSISAMLDNVDPVLESAYTTVGALDSSLKQMQVLFSSTADEIDDIISQVKAATDDEKIAILAEFLGGDPDEYAKFFSSLVDVEVEQVYSVASYGAAMAPFYSVLAIWVGGVILVAILKTHIDRKKYPGVTETQAFFGRFQLFFLVGQVQAAVIVAGDIFLLHCEPVHPWLMWLTAAVTSLVFNLLIYALTLSFGDIGKAIVVILMVLQIAGSSGSYPIEILPPIFDNVYRFFPFPYAINAMREALCGMYELDMYRYLAELMVFAVIALLIGLLIRKPFIGINNFVSEKLEETELL